MTGPKRLSCIECVYVSPDERRDGSWEYYCNLADERKIERGGDEDYPPWCPLLPDEEREE